MLIGEPLLRLPWIRRLHDVDEARAHGVAAPRMRAMCDAGRRLGDSLRTQPTVDALVTIDLTTLVYPTTFAFNRAVLLPFPYVTLSHRTLLLRVNAGGEKKLILFNPTDYRASEATPFFAQLLEKMPSKNLARRLLAKQSGQVDAHLRRLGVQPEEIDVIAFDHFHTQDLRPLIGGDSDGESMSARFPNAVVLAPAAEWNDWDDLHPLQKAWFVQDGKRGVPMDRVVLTDCDLLLGDGCMLLRTPGHTSGNQTLFVHGERGVFGVSENGCCADNWAPHESSIPGLRGSARQYGVEVILNSNTPELAAEQYNSMMLERAIVDRSEENPAFYQMFSSSEVTASAIAPGIKPTLYLGERNTGTL